ncbi:MAG: transketolase, partial [Desulfobacterales bacterium]|nr:transketolase [Desulfobacterales bacterium]
RQAIATTGPVALILSRQKLPVLDRTRYAPANGLKNGAYILSDAAGPADLILIASGSEVHLALAAQESLATEGIATRVVSMPSWELFEKMPASYKERVLPYEVKRRIAVEAGHPIGWERYVGSEGKVIGISSFGTSAPGAAVMAKFGMTIDNIIQKAKQLMG